MKAPTTDEYRAVCFESYKTAIELLRQIESRVDEINEKSHSSEDWGYVGDMNRIIGQLKAALT
jgi:hypothetical protein